MVKSEKSLLFFFYIFFYSNNLLLLISLGCDYQWQHYSTVINFYMYTHKGNTKTDVFLSSFLAFQVRILENLSKKISHLYTQHTLSEFCILDMKFLDLPIFPPIFLMLWIIPDKISISFSITILYFRLN